MLKKRFEKWLAIFIEKHASPTLIGKISEASQAWKDTLKKTIRRNPARQNQYDYW